MYFIYLLFNSTNAEEQFVDISCERSTSSKSNRSLQITWSAHAITKLENGGGWKSSLDSSDSWNNSAKRFVLDMTLTMGGMDLETVSST